MGAAQLQISQEVPGNLWAVPRNHSIWLDPCARSVQLYAPAAWMQRVDATGSRAGRRKSAPRGSPERRVSITDLYQNSGAGLHFLLFLLVLLKASDLPPTVRQALALSMLHGLSCLTLRTP